MTDEEDFRAAFVDAGRWYKTEITVIMFGAVGGLYLLERVLFADPTPFVDTAGSVAIGFVLATALRVLSCFRALRSWSTGLFIVSVLIQVCWLMLIRASAMIGGYDELPIIVPVAFLASLLIVHIRFVILMPTMLVGFGMIATIELAAVPITGARLFDLATTAAIILVPLASSLFHEQQFRLGWQRKRELGRLSTTDSLTELPNRRAFDAAIRSSLTGRGSVCLAILDIDEFKALNDSLGHAAGDRTLQAIADCLRAIVTDPRTFVGRLSGEEFVVVWEGWDPAEAVADLARIRTGIGGLSLPAGPPGRTLTMSAGFAHTTNGQRDPDTGADALLTAADSALYRSKHAGRDRLTEFRGPLVGVATATATPVLAPREPTADTAPHAARDRSLGERTPEFIAEYDASGHRARQAIAVGIAVITLIVLLTAEHALTMPAETLTVSRWILVAVLLPGTAVAFAGSTVPSLRPWSGPIQVAGCTIIVVGQTVLRALPLTGVETLITVLMPISVILSLGVVQIRFRLMFPAMVALFLMVTVSEIVAFHQNAAGILTLIAATSMVAVVVQAAYRLQDTAFQTWLRSDELHVAARHDPLTGLPNRRAFAEYLDGAIADRTAVAAVMIDVDHLKRYNDAYGHPAGDRCLQRIGEVLGATAQQSTMSVHRFGGEEFGALITASDRDSAIAVAESLVAAVRAADIESATPGTPLTVSAGLAVVLPDDDSESLVARADRALYDAKARGRDQLVVAEAKTKGAEPESPVPSHQSRVSGVSRAAVRDS